MGAIGGTVWHGVKGMRNSPRVSEVFFGLERGLALTNLLPNSDQGDRLAGSLAAIKARAPVVGGNFGVWGGMFSSFDCLIKGYVIGSC